ncbi:MAG: hypothetical protein ACXVDN_15550, partial [Ktedonobacteraceae bacterium]
RTTLIISCSSSFSPYDALIAFISFFLDVHLKIVSTNTYDELHALHGSAVFESTCRRAMQ